MSDTSNAINTLVRAALAVANLRRSYRIASTDLEQVCANWSQAGRPASWRAFVEAMRVCAHTSALSMLRAAPL